MHIQGQVTERLEHWLALLETGSNRAQLTPGDWTQ